MGKIIVKARQVRLAYQSRIGRPVSIQEIATRMGVTRAHLSNIELGKAWPNEGVLAGLCEAYSVEVGEILEFKPDELLADDQTEEGTAPPTGNDQAPD